MLIEAQITSKNKEFFIHILRLDLFVHTIICD